MSDDLLNILSNSNKDIDNQKLMDYLSDKLSETEKHEFEKEMVTSDMLNDVVEGLGKFKNKKDVNVLVEQLNSILRKQLQKKKSKKLKREIKRSQLALFRYHYDPHNYFNCFYCYKKTH